VFDEERRYFTMEAGRKANATRAKTPKTPKTPKTANQVENGEIGENGEIMLSQKPHGVRHLNQVE